MAFAGPVATGWRLESGCAPIWIVLLAVQSLKVEVAMVSGTDRTFADIFNACH
jgi:hypothetical protein